VIDLPPSVLEQLERIHDHSCMVAALSKELSLNGMDSLRSKRGSEESVVDDHFACDAEIESDRGVKAKTLNHRLFIRRPIGDLVNVFPLDQCAIKRDVERAGGNSEQCGYLPVLVGVRESMDVPHGCNCSMSPVPWTKPTNGPLAAGASMGFPTLVMYSVSLAKIGNWCRLDKVTPLVASTRAVTM
jgi:hypothetical protein